MVKSRDAEVSRLKILDEAEKQFAAMGLYGASVNSIAEKAGLNKRMLYHYFGSKEGLYREVLKRNFEKIYMMGRDAFAREEDVIASIRKGIHDYFYFLYDNPDYVKIIGWEELSGGTYIRDLIPDTLMIGLERLVEVYDQGVKEGIFKKEHDVMQLIISINALCFVPFARMEMLKEIWGNDFESKIKERLNHIYDMVFSTILEKCEGRF